MQYFTGTVSTTNGSAVVTGTGTSWSNQIEQGDAFTIAGTGVFYDVASVQSDTQLTLSTPYTGSTGSGLSYTIARDFTALNNIVEMRKGDIETAAIFTRAVRRIDQLLSLNQDAGAITSAGVYANTTDGIAGTTNSDYFFVPEGSEFVLYLNSSGSAVEQLRFASLAAAMQYASDAQQAASDAQTAQQAAETAQSGAEAAEANAQASATAAAESENNAAASEVVASQQAGLANDYANAASDDADRAEAAASAATLSAGIYDDTTAGIAATGDGEYFSTPSGDSNVYLELYRNDSGAATLIATYPTRLGIETVVGNREYLTTSTTFTLPSSPANGTKYVFTKEQSVTPTISRAGTDVISIDGQTDTTLNYDVDVQLIMIYHNGAWQVKAE